VIAKQLDRIEGRALSGRIWAFEFPFFEMGIEKFDWLAVCGGSRSEDLHPLPPHPAVLIRWDLRRGLFLDVGVPAHWECVRLFRDCFVEDCFAYGVCLIPTRSNSRLLCVEHASELPEHARLTAVLNLRNELTDDPEFHRPNPPSSAIALRLLQS